MELYDNSFFPVLKGILQSGALSPSLCCIYRLISRLVKAKIGCSLVVFLQQCFCELTICTHFPYYALDVRYVPFTIICVYSIRQLEAPPSGENVVQKPDPDFILEIC
jgi:hypothetical protein